MIGLVVFGVVFPAKEGKASVFSFIFPSTEAKDLDIAASQNSQNIDILDSTKELAVAGDKTSNDEDILIEDASALRSENGPLGTLADVSDMSSQPGADSISLYTVRSGDTISEIASMYGVSVNTIKWANDIAPGKSISVGDTLLILPINGVEHEVQKGDTLASIAKKYGGDSKEIDSYNELNGGKLVVGSKVIIPDGEMQVPTKAATVVAKKGSSGSASSVSTSGFIRPVKGIVTQWGHDRFRAIDVGAPTGTTVVASAGGKVIAAKIGWNGAYGNMVIISHPNGVQTLYAHLSKITVKTGDTVTQGQKIGEVGSTGRSTGPHLHFETRNQSGVATSLYQGAASIAKKK
jgi:murein DD-endopeptidase MepM/ murein hydrolase activator NlpD